MSCRIQKSRQVLAIVHEKKLQLQHRGLRRPAVWLAGWLAKVHWTPCLFHMEPSAEQQDKQSSGDGGGGSGSWTQQVDLMT